MVWGVCDPYSCKVKLQRWTDVLLPCQDAVMQMHGSWRAHAPFSKVLLRCSWSPQAPVSQKGNMNHEKSRTGYADQRCTYRPKLQTCMPAFCTHIAMQVAERGCSMPGMRTRIQHIETLAGPQHGHKVHSWEATSRQTGRESMRRGQSRICAPPKPLILILAPPLKTYASPALLPGGATASHGVPAPGHGAWVALLLRPRGCPGLSEPIPLHGTPHPSEHCSLDVMVSCHLKKWSQWELPIACLIDSASPGLRQGFSAMAAALSRTQGCQTCTWGRPEIGLSRAEDRHLIGSQLGSSHRYRPMHRFARNSTIGAGDWCVQVMPHSLQIGNMRSQGSRRGCSIRGLSDETGHSQPVLLHLPGTAFCGTPQPAGSIQMGSGKSLDGMHQMMADLVCRW